MPILIVDDNKAAADGLVRLMNALKHEARALYSGEELLSYLAEGGEVALAFIDIGMPGMDGYETIAAVRAAGHAFPAIALTGYGQHDDKERAREAGFSGHLTKPVGVDEFRAVLEALL